MDVSTQARKDRRGKIHQIAVVLYIYFAYMYMYVLKEPTYRQAKGHVD